MRDKFDNELNDKVKVRYQRYGFFRVTTEATPPKFCAKCLEEINGQSVIVNTRIFHPNCFEVSK